MRHILLATLATLSLAWTSQLFVTSASNQTRYMRNGVAGSALELDAADGSTACLAALADFDESTDATADLNCRNTGAIVADTYEQFTIAIDYVRDSGTVVLMQCDTSDNSGSTWRPIMTEDSGGNKDIRTWTSTQSVSGSIVHNFEINCELIRCRAWATSGGSGDTMAFSIILAK